MRLSSTANTTFRPAAVLVLVLWVLMALVILAVALSQRVRTDTLLTMGHARRATADCLARSGVQYALAVLADDDRRVDHLGEPWSADAERYKDVPVDGGTFSIYPSIYDAAAGSRRGLDDLSSRVNINIAAESALAALPGGAVITARAVCQWRTGQGPYVGASGEILPAALDFRRSAAPSLGNTARDARRLALPFETVDTLRLLPQIPLSWFAPPTVPDPAAKSAAPQGPMCRRLTACSFSWNQGPDGMDRININTASPDVLSARLGLDDANILWIVQHRSGGFGCIAEILDPTAALPNVSRVLPSTDDTARTAAADTAAPKLRTAEPDAKADPADPTDPTEAVAIVPVPLDAAAFARVADRITVTDNPRIFGRININTAPAAVLETLPDMTAAMARSIVTYRSILPAGYASIAELLSCPGMTVALFGRIAPWITVRSDAFTFYVVGRTAQGDTAGLEVIVARRADRDSETPLEILLCRSYDATQP